MYRVSLQTGEVTTLASGETNVHAVAATEHSVFWASSAGLVRTSHDGTGRENVADASNVHRIAVGAGALFWTENTTARVRRLVLPPTW